MQPVGELDEQYAHIVGDRQQQLAQVLGLLCFARHQLKPLQLGQPLHQRTDFLTEHLIDFGAGRFGVLDGVVKQRGDNCGVVQLQVGEDRGNLEGVRKVRIAGSALLLAMGHHGVDIGPVEQVFVGIGIIGPDPVHQVVLAHHFGPNGLLGRQRRGAAGAAATASVAACIWG